MAETGVKVCLLITAWSAVVNIMTYHAIWAFHNQLHANSRQCYSQWLSHSHLQFPDFLYSCHFPSIHRIAYEVILMLRSLPLQTHSRNHLALKGGWSQREQKTQWMKQWVNSARSLFLLWGCKWQSSASSLHALLPVYSSFTVLPSPYVHTCKHAQKHLCMHAHTHKHKHTKRERD